MSDKYEAAERKQRSLGAQLEEIVRKSGYRAPEQMAEDLAELAEEFRLLAYPDHHPKPIKQYRDALRACIDAMRSVDDGRFDALLIAAATDKQDQLIKAAIAKAEAVLK